MNSVAGGAHADRVARRSRQQALLEAFQRVRAMTVALTDGLSAEDCMLQSMPDASPVKWHLAHVTWFFETFVLEAATGSHYTPFDPAFRVIFNSYYLGVGERHPRAERGMISRPTLERVFAYRQAIDERIAALMASSAIDDALLDIFELGLNHEQQHQELILTDLKHHLWKNPLRSAWHAAPSNAGAAAAPLAPMSFIERPEGIAQIGADVAGFAFDNERPRHRAWLAPFAIASRPVTCGEYLRFIEDGGYVRPELWLSDGWDARLREAWEAPLYWECAHPDAAHDTGWQLFTLHGMKPLAPDEPVAHVSYYEADAYARWADARLPTEAQWECVAETEDGASLQRRGEVWEWTQSAYLPYPGFRVASGAVGEYNGKFMVNQMVLRGGSSATPVGHVRSSYRNFFPPQARWQFSGIRLARDL